MKLTDDSYSNVTCDCQFENHTVCHVTNMYVLYLLDSASSMYGECHN